MAMNSEAQIAFIVAAILIFLILVLRLCYRHRQLRMPKLVVRTAGRDPVAALNSTSAHMRNAHLPPDSAIPYTNTNGSHYNSNGSRWEGDDSFPYPGRTNRHMDTEVQPPPAFDRVGTPPPSFEAVQAERAGEREGRTTERQRDADVEMGDVRREDERDTVRRESGEPRQHETSAEPRRASAESTRRSAAPPRPEDSGVSTTTTTPLQVAEIAAPPPAYSPRV
ncbi:hypothetical protein BDV98DRAFT_194384 [Pterulicium gracile]|uniref:Uncharacterized protein n=1 Tax=Pterulicium gracile TaxID=1884261 RepID=A0A5C3QB44_9AGAR|nr:hypothetical protein BDV98DRAFT_194384 [Pterula gracilis]